MGSRMPSDGGLEPSGREPREGEEPGEAAGDPGDAPLDPSEIRVRSSVQRGNPPHSGPRPSPYRWTDIVSSDHPDPSTRSLGAYVVYHSLEVDAEVRVAFATRLDVFPSSDPASPAEDAVVVDEQISVHKRWVLRSLEGARQRFRSKHTRWRRVAQRHAPDEDRRLRERIAGPFVRAFALVAAWIYGGLLTLTELPDRVLTAGLEMQAVLWSHLGRRSVWESLWQPRELTVAQRTTSVGVVAIAMAFAVLALNSVFALGFPEFAGVYRYSLGLALTMTAGVLFAPVVVEPMLVVSTLAVGPVAAIVGMLAGKVLGSWILYLVGVTLNETVRDWTSGRPRIKEAVEWMTETADEYAFRLLFVGNLAPFISGFFLYVYAVAGVRFRDWIAGVTLGTLARFVVIVALVYIVGPDVVSAWLASFNPFA